MGAGEKPETAAPSSSWTASQTAAAVEAELTLLVERIQLEVLEGKFISSRSAEQLHDLRLRAERLLATCNGALIE